MMPPEQENSSIHGGAAINLSEKALVQIELPAGSTSNVSPCPDNQIPERDHATLVRFSVFAVTLKVLV